MDDQAKTGKPVVLAIAGFDPSGGAGIIVDARAIDALGCTPVSAATSITFQNSKEFRGAIHHSADSIRLQVRAICAQHTVAAVKIGMLPTAEVVREVARLVGEMNLPAPVVDPVLRSTSGHRLIEEDAIAVLTAELMPLARVVTPNIPEAEKLTGVTITNETQMRTAAARIRAMGVPAVLVKGGHLYKDADSPAAKEDPRTAIDILDNQGQVTVFRDEWIGGRALRGTGCMLSSAIAACLAKEKSLEESVRTAKTFVADLIRQAPNC